MKINSSLKNKKVGIIGAGKSGISASELAFFLGAKVFVSDSRKNINIINKLIEYEEGGHSEKILNCDFVIKSPGISNKIKIIEEIKKNKIPIYSEIEFASWFTKSYIIGVTGTNGKTTTIELLNHILKENKKNVIMGGNIGIPFAKNVLEEKNKKKLNDNDEEIIHLLELSSFQLENIKYFKPNISIILNITPDHLDRYIDYNEYTNSKLNILKNQDSECFSIINKKNYFDLNKNNIRKKIFEIKKTGEMKVNDKNIEINHYNHNLKGVHNKENILAAYLASKEIGIEHSDIIKSINSFTLSSHRIEKIKINCKINYFNDSKATNLGACIAAIKTLKKNIILILGGIDKNNTDFSILKKYSNKIQYIIIYGESRNMIKKTIPIIIKTFIIKSFEKSIKKSIKLSSENLNILLSPACASYDQFNSYEERGQKFKEIILKYYDNK